MKKCISCRREDGKPAYAGMCRPCFTVWIMRAGVKR